MAYMKYNTTDRFWIVPYNSDSLALNVYSSSVGANNQNVNLYTRNTDGTQAWYLDCSVSGHAFLRCNVASAYGLDRYSPNNNCDIYKVSGNYTDANIDFNPGSDAAGPWYRIKNVASGLFLTATSIANTANVVWGASSSSNAQKWRLIKYGTSSGGSTTPDPVVGQYAPGFDRNSINYTSRNPFGAGWCTWYAWGRTREAMGKEITFSQSSGRDAKNWYAYVTNAVQKIPASGAPSNGQRGVIVWTHNDGGHVAFIEKCENGYIWMSQANKSGKHQISTVEKETIAQVKAYCNRLPGGGFVGFLIF